MKTALAVMLTSAVLAAGPTHAQNPARVAAPDVVYVSGGIGSTSRDELAAREKEFNLKLVLTIVGTGTYVSDVGLIITNSAGKTLAQHTTQGPLFMAKLPDGAYTLSATFRGQTQTRKFQVRAGRLHTEYLRWPARVNDDWTLPWGAP
jgi:hypothetical protein